MKRSKEPAPPAENLDLEFPDWTGMDDSAARIKPEAALRLCALYPAFLAGARQGNPEPKPKEALPEFVL